MRGVDSGGRIGGAKRRQRISFGKPWKESRRRKRGGGYREVESHSGSQRKVVTQIENPECWEGYGICTVEKMTLYGRWRY